MGDRWRWALGGAAAAALALATGELVAGVLGGPSLIAAIGSIVISLQPPGAKDLMVSLFGTNDKLALEAVTGFFAILIGAVLGLLARRDVRIAVGGFVVFGLAGFFAAIGDPSADELIAAVAASAAVIVGVVGVYVFLPLPHTQAPALDSARRQLLAVSGRSAVLVGSFVVLGGIGAVIGRYLSLRTPALADPGFSPHPQTTAPPVPAGAAFTDITGLTPLVMPNDQFYKIDTRLTVPRLSSVGWKVDIKGLVNTPTTYTYEQLGAMELFEEWVTIACVSNQVGGPLVGNAKWTGVKLMPLLEQAGLKPEATQLVGRSFDGFTVGFPTDHLRGAGANAMIALLMNDQPLPPQHGFPLRLIVPGLYGYVSATKWLKEIELTRLEDFDAYWVPLGWSKLGPILTQSRIDVPRDGSSVTAGKQTVAGIAWAPTRGISKVEVGIDGAGWTAATLSVPLANTTWIQWRVDLAIPAGRHEISVRATDGTGALQDVGPTPPAPDGARGWHTIVVNAA
jgi:DMSO/TMAO reductase YedYZ molybdopterin-dependent catalytic subunit